MIAGAWRAPGTNAGNELQVCPLEQMNRPAPARNKCNLARSMRFVSAVGICVPLWHIREVRVRVAENRAPLILCPFDGAGHVR